MRLRAFNLIPGAVISEPVQSWPAGTERGNEPLIVTQVVRSDDERVVAWLSGPNGSAVRTFHFADDVELIGLSPNQDPDDIDFGTEDERSFEPVPIEQTRSSLPRRVPGLSLDVTVGRVGPTRR